MVALLLILWFLTGFLACIYYYVELEHKDIKFPSGELFCAILMGILGPVSLYGLLSYLSDEGKLPTITLFKARK